MPKSLGNPATRNERLAVLEQPHVAPLSAFVRNLRAEMGDQYAIPYFDPLDGGIGATCLFLLEAPGTQAVNSGFISRNNPDETAKNFLIFNQEAGLDRKLTVIWNIVPWYVGSGTKIRPVKGCDIGAAGPALCTLISLLPSLKAIVLVGRKAATAREAVARLAPAAQLFTVPHPSPVFVNRMPGNRDLIVGPLRRVAASLAQVPR